MKNDRHFLLTRWNNVGIICVRPCVRVYEKKISIYYYVVNSIEFFK